MCVRVCVCGYSVHGTGGEGGDREGAEGGQGVSSTTWHMNAKTPGRKFEQSNLPNTTNHDDTDAVKAKPVSEWRNPTVILP